MEAGAGGDAPWEDGRREGGRDELRRGHSWRRVEGHAGRECGSEGTRGWQGEGAGEEGVSIYALRDREGPGGEKKWFTAIGSWVPAGDGL